MADIDTVKNVQRSVVVPESIDYGRWFARTDANEVKKDYKVICIMRVNDNTGAQVSERRQVFNVIHDPLDSNMCVQARMHVELGEILK